VVDIYDKDIYSMTKKCFNFLEVKFASKDIEVVLIENQPAQKNPKMKSIQMIVFGFFAYKQHVAKQNINNIFFQSANNKNKFAKKMGIEVPEYKTKYLENKKRAVACTKILLNESWGEYFEIHNKKDDLADCFIQMLSFIEYKPVIVH
jgi:hypothetical protein